MISFVHTIFYLLPASHCSEANCSHLDTFAENPNNFLSEFVLLIFIGQMGRREIQESSLIIIPWLINIPLYSVLCILFDPTSKFAWKSINTVRPIYCSAKLKLLMVFSRRKMKILGLLVFVVIFQRCSLWLGFDFYFQETGRN